MSAAGRKGSPSFPAEWARLDSAAEEAATLLGRWIHRAREAEEEVDRLRRSLEEYAGERSSTEDVSQELRRLRAENAALQSRMQQARMRIGGLMQRLEALDVEP